MISERFGRGSRTVDLELEAQIDVLRDTKRKYENVLRLARALTNHFYNMVQTQHALGDTFAELSQKSPELRVRAQNQLPELLEQASLIQILNVIVGSWVHWTAFTTFSFLCINSRFSLQDEFGYNAETQKLLCKNGETLLGAINFFVSSINTLVNKTMEDTLMTIKMYENAR